MNGRKKSAEKELFDCMMDETTSANCNVAELHLKSGRRLTVHKSSGKNHRAAWRLNGAKIPASEALEYLKHEVIARRTKP